MKSGRDPDPDRAQLLPPSARNCCRQARATAAAKRAQQGQLLFMSAGGRDDYEPGW
eukprot:SAG22_NODE_21249_length_258_cov_1.597484_1_plen_55_part_10